MRRGKEADQLATEQHQMTAGETRHLEKRLTALPGLLRGEQETMRKDMLEEAKLSEEHDQL